eukprot:SAG31_NODE_1163_length_9588_cov_8.265676_6_plen_672_part_00
MRGRHSSAVTTPSAPSPEDAAAPMSLFEEAHRGTVLVTPTPEPGNGGAELVLMDKEGYLEKFTEKVERFSRRYFIIETERNKLCYSRGRSWASYPLDRILQLQMVLGSDCELQFNLANSHRTVVLRASSARSCRDWLVALQHASQAAAANAAAASELESSEDRPMLPTMTGHPLRARARLTLRVESYGPMGLMWNDAIPQHGRTPTLRVADIVHGSVAAKGCPELRPGMFVERINGYEMVGLPPSRMLEFLAHRPVTIGFVDRLAFPIDEFVPWLEEAHNDPPAWRETLDGHNRQNSTRPVVAQYTGTLHGASHSAPLDEGSMHLSPAEAAARQLFEGHLPPAHAGHNAGANEGIADEKYKGFLGFPVGLRAPIYSITIYPHLPQKTYIDRVAFQVSGGEPVYFGCKAQEKALVSAKAKILFETHDKDKSGTLEEGEVSTLIDEMVAVEKGKKNPKRKENNKRYNNKAQAFKDMDVDGNGSVEFEEFLAWWQHDATHRIFEAKAKELFDNHDEDNSGQLDEKEIISLAKEIGVAMSKAEAIVLDADQSGEISFEEFMQWYKDKIDPPTKEADKLKFELEAGEYIAKVIVNQKRPAGPVHGMQVETNTARSSAWVGDADCGPGGKARRQKDLEEISAPEGYEIVGLQFADNGKQCPPIEKLLLRVVNKVAPQ